ncbi:MAG: phosphopentomutase [Bryobacterales bacterium]|nr:phosphopentomutase [Bryobacterales bacterium]MEB2362586.1 phosphopentomutase [Bryobacterales bacterium]
MVKAFRRIAWIVLDSVGIGEMPDAADYGDAGSDTLGNVARKVPLSLPNFQALGLGNLKRLPGIEPAAAPEACYGRCALASPGKDTTTGHWEMAGIHLAKPFPLFPSGFPPRILRAFEERIGRGTLGNCAASGTEIIRQLGSEHMETGKPIVYTSADSVFQVAAHEQVISLAELYRICEIAREILHGPDEVGRVIARPFIGQPGAFTRTANRKDFAVPPPPGMLLDSLQESSVPVWAIGKIGEIFLGRGICHTSKTRNNADGMEKTMAALHELPEGLIFTNLVDFDQLYGHRNDSEGYARALEAVDEWLPGLRVSCQDEDLVIFTADHGCDPTTPSTDHSREYVPLLAWGPNAAVGRALGTRETLSDIGQTVAENFGVHIANGKSFLEEIVA